MAQNMAMDRQMLLQCVIAFERFATILAKIRPPATVHSSHVSVDGVLTSEPPAAQPTARSPAHL